MDSSEYLKYMTERVVSYMERSEDEETSPPKKSREPWLTKWFGVAPLGLMVWWMNRTESRNKTRPEARSANSSN
ncbi:YqzE family protein [Cohnella terricola]|uniref:YqzE family protein n=1 Tax=Cohnella terricola TaxID=1289167 RepID=A0A559JWS5_9BACL|nr:YqzE family protein [Cohnella terricola]TVY04341.1 YqzE family protein [Cohnella terricola]